MAQSKDIIVRLLGGLGNQFFQLALGSILAHKSNRKLFVDSSLLCDHSHGRHLANRTSKLYILDHTYPEIGFHSRLRNNGFGCSVPFRAYSRILRTLFPITELRETSAYNSISKIITAIHNQGLFSYHLYLDGCWQYIEGYTRHENIITNSLCINKLILDSVRDAAKASDINFETSVAVHVRRNDYLLSSNQDYIISLDPDYYQSALQRISSHINVSDIQYYIFSDDLEWCRTNLSYLSDNTIFVNKPSTLSVASDVYDFLFMSLFKYFVIPNSTFSLWSSYLSVQQGKYAIAPRQWFHGRNGPPLLNLGYAHLI